MVIPQSAPPPHSLPATYILLTTSSSPSLHLSPPFSPFLSRVKHSNTPLSPLLHTPHHSSLPNLPVLPSPNQSFLYITYSAFLSYILLTTGTPPISIKSSYLGLSRAFPPSLAFYKLLNTHSSLLSYSLTLLPLFFHTPKHSFLSSFILHNTSPFPSSPPISIFFLVSFSRYILLISFLSSSF